MMKKCYLSIIMGLMLICTFFSNAHANVNRVPLNDDITVDKLSDEFTRRAMEVNSPLRLKKHDRVVYVSELNLNINRFIPDDNAIGANANVYVNVPSYMDGKIYEIDVWVKLSDTFDFYDSFKALGEYTLLIERAVGTPGGEGYTDGLFALMDANKKGSGAYWSPVTNRKYTINKVSDEKRNAIGYAISATI